MTPSKATTFPRRTPMTSVVSSRPSGTTGTPKAVPISHRLLIDRMSRHGTVFGSRLANCGRIYSDAPISSVLGFQFLIHTLWRGGTYFLPGDSFDNTLQAIERYKVQAIMAPPSGLELLWRWFDRMPAYQSNIETIIAAVIFLLRRWRQAPAPEFALTSLQLTDQRKSIRRQLRQLMQSLTLKMPWDS